MRRLLLLPLLALAACNSASGKLSLPAEAGEVALGVRVVAPKDRLDEGLVRVTGRIVPKREAAVSAKANGTIAAFLVDVGDRVKKGDVMARLDSANAAIGLEQARAAKAMAQAGFENARRNVERARQLHKTGGVAQAQLDAAEAGFQQAQASLEQATAAEKAASQMLFDHSIRAPFSGVVTARQMTLGEFVAVAVPVFTLVDTDDLELVLPVPETVVDAVEVGSEVAGVVNPSGHPFTAKVRVVGEVIDSAGRTVEVRADLVGEKAPQVRPHAMVEVSFNQSDVEGLFLPRQALRGSAEAPFVWVVEDGLLVRRDVRAEVLVPGTVRVTEGLEGNETIVADAGTSFREGMKVRPLR